MTRDTLFKGDSYAGGPNVTAGFRVMPPFQASGAQTPPLRTQHQQQPRVPGVQQLPRPSTTTQSGNQQPPNHSGISQSLESRGNQQPVSPSVFHHQAPHPPAIHQPQPIKPPTNHQPTHNPVTNGQTVPYGNPPVHQPPAMREDTSPDPAVSDGSPANGARFTKDEKRLREAGVTLNIQHVIGLPMEEFNQLLGRQRLTEIQQELCRDVRKRGKNKWAAQNCRKRKIDQLDELTDRLDKSRDARNRLREEHERLISEYENEARRLNSLTEKVLNFHQKSSQHFLVQVDIGHGDIVKILPKSAVREEERVPQPVEKYRLSLEPDNESTDGSTNSNTVNMVTENNENNCLMRQTEDFMPSIPSISSIADSEIDEDLRFLVQ